MTLTTQCPYCKTSFKVTEEQLAQHKGAVRCGVCSQVFNGHDYLQSADGHPLPSLSETNVQPNKPAADLTSTSAEEFSLEPPVSNEYSSFSAVADHDETLLEEPQILLGQPLDHDWDMHPEHSVKAEKITQAMHTDAPQADHDIEPVLIDTPQKTAQSSFKDEPEPHLDEAQMAVTASKPDFIEQSKKRDKRRRVLGWLLGPLSFLLVIAALMQAAYFWRHQIIANIPATQRIFETICKPLHCTIGLATQIDDLSLESNDLQAIPDQPNTYQLNISVRNNSEIPQTWPDIELTLNNQANTPMVRKVFTPQEYLALPELIDGGIMMHMEQPITVKFTLPEDVSVSGYQVYLFYP